MRLEVLAAEAQFELKINYRSRERSTRTRIIVFVEFKSVVDYNISIRYLRVVNLSISRARRILRAEIT